MREVYRKRGSVVRWENGALVRVSEGGVAVQDGELFTCEPDPTAASHVDAAAEERVLDAARAVVSAIEPPLRIERLIVSDGTAHHECDGRTWSERSQRVHLSIVHGRTRALVDLGDLAMTGAVAPVVEALGRCGPEREPPPRLRLAPGVAAALVPSLIGVAPPNVELWQSGGGTDGKGHRIEEVRIEREPWPNWYRPSYRVRPVRMPLDVRLRCDVTEIEGDRPLAVALLAPADGLVLRVLVDDGRAAWPATVRVARIDAVARDAVWYPYGGGSFGAEMML